VATVDVGVRDKLTGAAAGHEACRAMAEVSPFSAGRTIDQCSSLLISLDIEI